MARKRQRKILNTGLRPEFVLLTLPHSPPSMVKSPVSIGARAFHIPRHRSRLSTLSGASCFLLLNLPCLYSSVFQFTLLTDFSKMQIQSSLPTWNPRSFHITLRIRSKLLQESTAPTCLSNLIFVTHSSPFLTPHICP